MKGSNTVAIIYRLGDAIFYATYEKGIMLLVIYISRRANIKMRIFLKRLRRIFHFFVTETRKNRKYGTRRSVQTVLHTTEAFVVCGMLECSVYQLCGVVVTDI